MKRIITLVAVLAISLPTVFAQGKPDGKDEGWKDRVKAEKIAFITSELELTSDEAQVFWPVYNKYSELGLQLNGEVRKAYKELGEAVKNGADIEAKLNAYTAALDGQTAHAAEAAAEYCKVIPVEKVAKLYLAEERFRFQQIERLHNGGNQPMPQNGRRPGKGPQQPQPQPQQPQPRNEANAQE